MVKENSWLGSYLLFSIISSHTLSTVTFYPSVPLWRVHSVSGIVSLPFPWVVPIFTSRFSSNVTSSINFPTHSLAPLPIWVRHLLSCLNLWEYTYCNTQILYYTHMLTVLTLSLDWELLGVSLLSTQCPVQASLSWTFIKSPKRGQRPSSVKT